MAIPEEHTMARRMVRTMALVILAAVAAQGQGGSTAREYADQMSEMALSWQADAILMQVGAWTVHMDGTADVGPQGWFYTYYSPSAKQWRLFQLGTTGFVQRAVASGPTLPLPEGYLDSHEAMGRAIKSGFKPEEENLMLLGAASSKKIPESVYWIVGRADQRTGPASARGYLIDAITGALAGRL